MRETKGYRNLIVWQKSIDLVADIYQVCRMLPRDERFGMVDQMRRAAVSVTANIAEGQGRNGKPEFIHFLGIAQGSLCELDALITVATRVKYLKEDVSHPIELRIREIRVLLFALVNTLRRNT